MRSEFRTLGIAAAFAAVTALSLGAPLVRAADNANELPPDRDEIIVTHSRLGPLSDWAQMQAHTADYERLKAKFDPTTGSSHVDNWANDRASTAQNGSGDAFMDESAAAPPPSRRSRIRS
jgi:hypothetical protein